MAIAYRLGCKPDIEEGLNDIKSNNFFKSSIDWELVSDMWAACVRLASNSLRFSSNSDKFNLPTIQI